MKHEVELNEKQEKLLEDYQKYLKRNAGTNHSIDEVLYHVIDARFDTLELML